MARKANSQDGPRRILGIDFSGATDAGRKIWIAEAHIDLAEPHHSLTIDACFPAIDLPLSGLAPALAIAALADYVTLDPTTVAGCDFPFSLPAALVDAETWQAFIAAFPRRFLDHESYRNDNRQRTNLLELKRQTDRIAGTPFNSYNLRLYRQAWWGMAHLLHPLVTQKRATIAPQMPIRKSKPVLIEVCAACSLKHLDCYPAYKGRDAIHRAARKRILDCLIDLKLLSAPNRRLRQILLDNSGGDALDAVIGAIATARADLGGPVGPLERLEGRVYFQII
jgi:hypothetical protein